MTEQTQTTAQRIQDMLDMNFNFYPGPPGVTAKTIAAEIDRLTADNAQANQWLVNGVAKIAELEKQLAEARADEEEAMRLVRSWKAEVERLRPAAEAWRSLPEDVQIDAEVSAAARAAKEGR